MMKLKEKYADVIKDMVKDAQANVAEAEANVEKRTEELQECEDTVKEIKITAKNAHKAFLDVIKTLGKLAVVRNPGAEDVSKAIEPCNIYATAAAQMPVAEEELKEAKEKLSEANRELNSASVDLKNISFFA